MRHLNTWLLLLCLPLLVAGCSDAGKVDSGGVSLVITNFSGLPSQVGVEESAAAGLVTIDSLTLSSIVQNPNLGTTDLQTIELSSYEVVYTRADTGNAVPTPLVEKLISSISPSGTIVFNNLPILRSEQLRNPPLSDLLFVNGGFDQETGSDVVRLNLRLRFFGRTLGGRDVATDSQSFTVEFRPSLL